MTSPSVLIVGAGPTGLVLALWLTRLGVTVRIVDKAAEAGTTSRALAVQARTLEFYRQLGIADGLVDGGVKIAGINLWVRGVRAARLPFLSIGQGLSPYPFPLIFPQDAHERFLIERLHALGVEVERRTELVRFDEHDGGVHATLRRADGVEERCDAAYLAGCDGARSTVRDILAVGFPGGTYNQLFYVADVDASGPPTDNELHAGLDDADFLLVFPLKGKGRVRLVGTVREQSAGEHRDLTFEAVSSRVIGQLSLNIDKVNWFSTYHVHHRVAHHFRAGRAFLVGDAAHIHSPVGGQGMNTGIGDAVNLAWKLAAVLKGGAAERLLDTYEPERIAFARRLVATTDRVFTFVTRRGPIARFVRTRVVPLVAPVLFRLPPMRRFAFLTVSQTGINYRGSALSAGVAGTVHGGDRLPWVETAPGHDNFEPLSSLAWQAHVYGEPPPDVARACEELRLPLHRFAWRAAMGKAGLKSGALYLIRPDGYVALADPQADPARLRRIMTLMLKCVWLAVGLSLPSLVWAQSPNQAGPFQLPTVIVTAQKEPADPQRLPVSVTAVPRDTLASAGVTILREAAIYSPNTQFSDFTARKLSNARFRGIGSSPANPSITTYFDGVPQLNSNTSSIDLIGVDQVEFVRGPQSALFGRNTLAGVINVTSMRPSLSDWTYSLSVPVANFSSRDVRGTFSGPLAAGRVGISGAIGYGRRDGFTRNSVTGNDVDYREGLTGKGQVLWTPSSLWEARLIVTGERARDGDYALSDLGGLRSSPFEVARDFEGYTNRDLLATTVLTRRAGGRVNLSTTTGFVRWQTEDATDLDYTPAPLLRRDNAEESFQFTQEVRVASAANTLSDRVPLSWQAGLFLFTQNYEQDAVNTLGPFVLSPFLAFSVAQHAPQATLDDVGVGVYGQATATLADRVDVTAGARMDHESKTASLRTFFSPAIAPERLVTPGETFSNVSPQLSVAVRLEPDRMVYGSLGRGFKAGGFNAASPAGSEAYGEEQTWNLEGGVKTTWAGGRVIASAALFRIDWEDLQLNLPDPAVPAQFFIANVGGASSKGIEFEVQGRARPGIDLFTAFGYTHARFKDGSISNGVNVAGNRIPNTPAYTATVGAQVSRALRVNATVYGRADATFYGAFAYDDLNMAEQGRYSLANLRAGVRSGYVFAEGWMRNAFDTRYIPVALAFDPRIAPSGFLGESGAPRTFGISAGVTF